MAAAPDIQPIPLGVLNTTHNPIRKTPSQQSGAGPQLCHPDTTSALASCPHEEPVRVRSKLRLAAVIAGLYLSLFIAALDQTIVATAIPTISSDLKSAAGYTWIGGAYLLANAAASPIWAKLSDIWGRKPMLLVCVGAFMVSSIICAVSNSMAMLVVGRALQGTCGGGLIQLVHITISDIFSMRSRTLYLGLLEAMWAIAGGAGPILGGAFTQLATWRWNFWINLPICGTTFVLLMVFLDVHNPRTTITEGLRAIDWLGTLSILGFTIMILLPLNLGGGHMFLWSSAKTICLLVFGALMLVCFIYSEKRLARYPLMPVYLFARLPTIAGMLVGFFHGMVFIGGEYYLPLYFQSVRSAAPLRSGVLILPVCVTEALMGIAAGIIIHRTGRYQELIWLGSALLTLGFGLFIHLDTTSSIAEIVAVQIVAGLGAGMLFEPPLIALQALVSQEDTATTTGTFGFVRNLATSSSVVLGGVVFQNGMATQHSTLEAAGLAPFYLDAFSSHSAAANVMIVGAIPDPRQRQAVKEAFAWSLRNMWIMYTCISCLGIVAGMFVVQRSLSWEHQETRTGIAKERQSGAEVSEGERRTVL